ncbi:hypothetical protein [Candidatus Regiella insecticola]
MIQDDVRKTAEILKNREIEIPSSWQCMRGGLAIMLSMMLWQAFIALPYLSNDKTDVYESIGFSTLLGFFIFLSVSSLTAKYLSLPKEVRVEGIVMALYKSRAKIFATVWLITNISTGIFIKLFIIKRLS